MKTDQPSLWFRMYAEFAHDPKVQMLSEVDQRRYVMLLCLRCGNGDVTLQKRYSNADVTFRDEEIAFQLRISVEEWARTKAVLAGKNLINEYANPVNWDKRQFASDSSSERVRKHRSNKNHQVTERESPCNGDVTLQERYGNGDVTAPEAEAEAETPIGLQPLSEEINGVIPILSI